ncbi:gliding motility-associated C-terminal domain-containing protein [Chryseobacterium sp. 3008163]|uniref:T9SS type B sorting domain-containing protein n=1 Tax=Chryseobacterium sp. 3008163 TaxID=2478663 RepID=UPI000F0C0B53|nr:gliding motility-associated C-terminal domain-containing protein [Chryseobacterium sp. 3008163]AYN01192.1 gliding motility-associated C-terminal domain-containing protein [Chryseobacterium sp. 3008163]
MKKFLLSLCIFLSLLVNAQLDTEHWFAPMSASSLQGTAKGYLYLSTDQTTPFSVQVFNNNTLFTTVQVSKNNPVQLTIPNSFMISSALSNLFVSNSMGLNVKGSKKFFANFRFSVPNQAEIITSKGLAGIGKNFFVGMAPNTTAKPYVNSTIGVTATEDNTTVTLSGYNPNVVFSDGISAPTRTFTLNKGKSYIIEAQSDLSPNNLSGLVGAKIVASKPISVTNGNFNSIYTTQNSSNVDVLMDQAVPVERLGKDFVMVKGNGPSNSGMEAALVIATANNTKLTVNGNLLANVTLNEGDFYLVQGTYYVHQGNNNFNMSISSNNNVYVYQLLAGASGSTVYATGGMNFIPPLSCFMPNKIEEIGFINKIGSDSFSTKLNIITQTGAVVTFNGNNINTANGPYAVTGNPNWVTYSIPNVTGNITVNSTKALTAGIAAGDNAVGYGGYFAGFSSVPAITKTGDCYLGVLLQVDNNYDSYQWYLNGIIIPGATTFSINPELYGTGIYTCMVSKNNCETKLTSEYDYTLCPPISTTTYNIGSCSTKVINPAFTTSTQAIVPNQTAIIAAPTSGTAVVNPTTGQITYTPNLGLTLDTTDTFTYYIQGNGNPASFEYFKVIINIDVLQVNNATLTTCSANGNSGIFNLTTAVVTPDAGTTVTYYTDALLTTIIGNPSAYISNSGIVYANVTSANGCSKVAQITLTVNPGANINTTNYNANLCDDNFDGIINVNFTTVTPQIVANSTNFTVKYYLNQADATAGNNNTLPANWTYSANTTVYVRVESTNGCPPVFGQINFTIGNKLPLLTTDYTTLVCDDNSDGTETVNLDVYKNNFTTDNTVSLTYHNTLADAQNGTNAVNVLQIIAPTKILYIRFQKPNSCPNIAKITLSLDTITSTNATLSGCANNTGTTTFNLTTANVTSTAGATLLYYSNAVLTTPITAPSAYNSGTSVVYVKITSPFGCIKTAQISLVSNPLPNVNTGNYNAALCDDNFDGIINVNFANITPQIVINSGSFTVRYYLNQTDATAGNNNTLPLNWTYTTSATVYVRVDGTNDCPSAFGQINFSIGNRITLLTNTVNTQICDNDLNGSENVNLNDFKNQFTTDPSVSLTFHLTLANAQAGTNAVAAQQTITGSGTYYIRFTNNNACPNTGTITITLKSGKKSETLKNQIICSDRKAILNAGDGFTSYLWSTGETTSFITAGVGTYFVDLTFNGCIYRQTVNVTAAQSPTITSIQVTGSNATVNVSGGAAPYQYSLNGIDYQSSNIFYGLTRGTYKVYVLGANGCQPVTKEFIILNLVNTITPNGDGHNDVLNYSELRLKQNVSIEVVDRYGAPVYKSSDKNYIWDGKSGGRPLSTGTYWYILKWIEPETKLPVSHSGWLLIKNRE